MVTSAERRSPTPARSGQSTIVSATKATVSAIRFVHVHLCRVTNKTRPRVRTTWKASLRRCYRTIESTATKGG
eukprot:9296437-Pyramimonas_sp.AAC.2